MAHYLSNKGNEDLQSRWANIQPCLTIRNERQYDRVVRRLNALLGEIGIGDDQRAQGSWIPWAR
jgi:hypothetical protein